MPNAIDDLCYQLALANRIVAHEGVLDGFGHISVRHPDKPDHYLLSRSRSPELVEPGDILELDIDSERGHARQHPAVWRVRDPRRDFPRAAGRDDDRASPFAGDPAVLPHRPEARADQQPRRHHG